MNIKNGSDNEAAYDTSVVYGQQSSEQNFAHFEKKWSKRGRYKPKTPDQMAV